MRGYSKLDPYYLMVSLYKSLSIVYEFYFSPFTALIIFGMKKENTNNPMEKKTLKDISSSQFPDAQTSFNVPIKKVKMNVPTIIPKPVPKK